MIVEELCTSCGKRVIQVRLKGKTVLLDWYASDDGNIIIKGDNATALPTAERAKELLKRLGVPTADRYMPHICRSSKRRRR